MWNAPQRGDIICFIPSTAGSSGHVGIVKDIKEVGGEIVEITIAHQNVTTSNSDAGNYFADRVRYEKIGSEYKYPKGSAQGLGDSYWIEGWLRRPAPERLQISTFFTSSSAGDFIWGYGLFKNILISIYNPNPFPIQRSLKLYLAPESLYPPPQNQTPLWTLVWEVENFIFPSGILTDFNTTNFPSK